MKVTIMLANIYWTGHFVNDLTYIDSFTPYNHLKYYHNSLLWMRKLTSDSNPSQDLNACSLILGSCILTATAYNV